MFSLYTNYSNFFKYAKDLFKLALPLFIGNLGHTLIGLTDVAVVSRYSIDSLAAISIANSVIFTISILGIGIITAISIILSNLRGAKNPIKKYLPSTLIFAFILSSVFAALCYFSNLLIPKFGFDLALIPYIQEYTVIVSFSMFGIFFFESIKQFLQSYEIVKFPNILSIVMVIFNLIFDIIFVFGVGFIPSMGSKGAAIATLIVRLLMGFIMFIYVFRFIDIKNKIYLKYIKQVIKVGMPIGIALMLEFFAFNIVTILIGREAGILAAVHNILIAISSATYMVPLAISTALSIKVAYYYGAKLPEEIKKYSYCALFIGVGFMGCAGLCLAIFPKQIINLFTSDINALTIAMPLISIAAVYQVFDGFQCITGAVLKGFKMTQTVSACVLLCYWIIGAPVAYFFVVKQGFSLRGYWLALAVALCTIGFIQAAIAKRKYKKIRAL